VVQAAVTRRAAATLILVLLAACGGSAPAETTPDPGAPTAVDPTAGATLVTDPRLGSTDPSAVWLVTAVSQRPALRTPLRLVYPDSLREKGLSGMVMLEYVVDTLGRVEPAIRVVQAAHRELVEPAKEMLRSARYRPARVHGRAVRVLLATRVRVGGGAGR